ncbi:antibiotic biosynthesis monooxygenase [Actinotignum urinale]|uniref:Antibiotic biosynthesis monooxygenase n=1 Tax=Actinotignum urinale TaxID=190146 RepID=A0AAW9HXK2_9ACTO|nr:antibiotic biosynthesis monooxygenase [Actinotignum urinale]MDY5128834.1 antibiotic biosynthesis monooxygenase [Actinotignum urinale]MDY5133306.1 antibiotic biosynthesis monooxygenase [Actinotignum urinale]MDY5152123.1 antibiotic biosynthesis monooxygenase [Actinotignum urinale]MDY5154541.1 antibiotic biosynthesis monooxygenase [Actinotignum urinale]MDY5160259.1 antibiotic biosynthesis monooxygenase [Actinotignum urinale]
MGFVNIVALTYPEGMEAVVEQRFANRKAAVDKWPGFRSFKLLRPVSGETRYFVMTEWESKEAYEAWAKDREQHPHNTADQPKNRGLSIDLLTFDVVQSAGE